MKPLRSLILLAVLPLAAQKPQQVASRTEIPPAPSPQQQQSIIAHTSIQILEKKIDARLSGPPTDLMGNTRGIYLPGFGVVLTAEVAAVPVAGLSPFHMSITPEEKANAHKKKLDALPKLRETIKAALVAAAADLGSVPANEKVILGVNLFYWVWEDRAGLPSQIIMQAPRAQLAGHPEAVQVQEF